MKGRLKDFQVNLGSSRRAKVKLSGAGGKSSSDVEVHHYKLPDLSFRSPHAF